MKKDKCNACSGFPTAGAPCEPNNFPQAVVEINNPEECPILFHKVVIPVSMGDDTTVPPVIGKYSNVLLVYEANNHSYLYSSDGVPTRLNNGFTDYEDAINLPKINGVTLLGNKTSEDLHITDSSLKIAVDWTTQTWSGADSVEDVYDYFANKGKVVLSDSADDGGEYSYEIIFMVYVPDEHKILGIIQFGNVVNDGEGHQEFDGTFAYGTIELYNQDRGVYAGSMEVQRPLTVFPNTGLNFDYGDTLSGAPATENSLGMIKVGPGLNITENGVLTVTEDIKGFDTVAGMKTADNLVDGSIAQTLGYYTKGDGGSAKYKIRTITNEDVVDEMTIIALQNESLVAELVLEMVMSPEQFGAKGDDSHNDTNHIQKAIVSLASNGGTLKLQEKTYLVEQIRPLTNTKIEGSGSASIIKGTTTADRNRIIFGNSTSGWRLNNFKIDVNSADRPAITSSDIAVSINGGSNVEISNLIIIGGTVTNAYCIRVGKSGNTRPSNITIRGCDITVSNGGFNGIAVTAGKNIWVKDNIIHSSYAGTGYAIDVEANHTEVPLSEEDRINNVYVLNNVCDGSGIGCIGAGNSYNGQVEINGNIINHAIGNSVVAIEALNVNEIKDVDVTNNQITYSNASSSSAETKYCAVRLNGTNINFNNNIVKSTVDSFYLIRTLTDADNLRLCNNYITSNNNTVPMPLSFGECPSFTLDNNTVESTCNYMVATSMTATSGIVAIKNNLFKGTQGRGFYISGHTTLILTNNYVSAYRNYISGFTNAKLEGNMFNRLSSTYEVFENDINADNTNITYSDNDVITNPNSIWKSSSREFLGNFHPTSGSWKRGDFFRNAVPTASGAFGWVCTEAGTPGTWASVSTNAN